MRVLVIQNKMIGDVLTSTVICKALKSENPNWIVDYMIQPNTFAVVEHNPYIDSIIFFDPEKNKGIINLWKLGKELKRHKYDVVIDAYGKWESVLPAYFSDAKKRIGFRKWYTSLLYTKTIVPEKNIENAAVFHRLQLAHTLKSSEITNLFPKIYLSESEIINAKDSIQKSIDPSLNKIMIAIVGSGLNKSLPPAYMAVILDTIAKKNKVALLFNFMPHQEKEALAIYNLCKDETKTKIVLDFYSKNLRDFLAVLSQCKALIGNEGGAVNMAKALNIKTFTIFSPWINKSSWSLKNDMQNHDAVHLNDYFPEIYNGKHAKKFKKQALKLYLKLHPSLFLAKLNQFLNNAI